MRFLSKILFIIVFIFAFFANSIPYAASNLDTIAIPSSDIVDICTLQGEKYGDGKTRAGIDQQCFQAFFNQGKDNSFDLADDQDIFALAYKNMIFFEKYLFENDKQKARYVISGDQADLSHIQAVDIDEENQNIHVLQYNPTRISLFQAQAGGNISPIRKLMSSDIKESTNLVVNPYTNELAVIFAASSKIKFFNREADINGRHQHTLMKLKRELYGPKTTLKKPIDAVIDPTGELIIILDQEDNQVVFFDWKSSDNSAPIYTIKGNLTQIKNPKNMYFSISTNNLEVQNGDGKTLIFSLKNFDQKKSNRPPQEIIEKKSRQEKFLSSTEKTIDDTPIPQSF